MAKYHWERITGDPELYKDLMVNLEVDEGDDDTMSEQLCMQLPDECSEGALPFRNAGLVMSLSYAQDYKGIWGIIFLCDKYLYEGDVCAGDDAGPFDDLSEALKCISGPARENTLPGDFHVWSAWELSPPLIKALTKQLIEGGRVSIDQKPHVFTQGMLKKV
jgi:hypothetical protein